jgi:hypothetical protein
VSPAIRRRARSRRRDGGVKAAPRVPSAPIGPSPPRSPGPPCGVRRSWCRTPARSSGSTKREAALRVIRSARLAPGAEAARFEGLLSRLAGAADAVALNSGTTALNARAPRRRGTGWSRGRRAFLDLRRAPARRGRAREAVPRLSATWIPTPSPSIPTGCSGARRPPPRAVVLVHPFGLPVPVEPYRAPGRGRHRGLRAVPRRPPAGAAGGRRRRRVGLLLRAPRSSSLVGAPEAGSPAATRPIVAHGRATSPATTRRDDAAGAPSTA